MMRARRRTVSYNDADIIDNSFQKRFDSLRHSAVENMTKTLNSYRKTSLLCDFIIKIDGIDFPVHKVIMAAASPFFAALFECKENSFIENSQNFIQLQDISAENFDKVITYCYCGDIDLDANNVQEIAKASSMYQLSNLFELCLEFMFGNIDPVNAIGLLCFAEYYASNSYKIRIKRYIEQNFSEICTGDEFKMLPDSILKSFLRSEDLSIFTENEVLLATLNWFAHDETKRMKFFREFIGYLRMPLISASEIEHIRDKFRNTNILKHFEELLQPKLCDEYKNTPYFQIRFHPRFCARKKIFVVGGNTLSNTIGLDTIGSHQVKTLIMSTDTCKIIQGPSLLSPVADSSSAILGDYLYVAGGIFQDAILQNVQRLNIREKNSTWETFSPMLFCRHSCALVVHKQELYAIGGRNGAHPVNNIEVYDRVRRTWVVQNYLPQLVCGYSTVKIRSVCYFIPNSIEWQTFHSYDMDKNCLDNLPFWTRECIRRDFATVVLHDSIYVIGGVDIYNRQTKFVNVYNIREKTWHTAAQMKVACSNIKAFVLNNIIHVLGAHGKSHRSKVESYDPATNTWFNKAWFPPNSIDFTNTSLVIAD